MSFRQKIYSFLSGSGQSTIGHQMLRAIMITVIGLLLLLDVVIYWIVFDRIYAGTTESIKQTLRVESSYVSQFIYRYMDDLCILRHIVDFNNPDKSFAEIERLLKNHGNPYTMYRLTLPDGTSYNSITGRDSASAVSRMYYQDIFNGHQWMCFESCRRIDVLDADCCALSLLVQNEQWTTLGIITVYFPPLELDNHLSKLKLNGTGSCLFVEGSGLVRRYTDTVPVSMHIDDFLRNGFTGFDTIFVNSFERYAKENFQTDYMGVSEFRNETKTPIVVYYSMIPGVSNLALALAIPKIEFYKDYYFILLVMVVLSIAIVVALFVLAKRLTRKLVSAPLERVNAFTNDFADGNLYSTAIDGLQSNNEFIQLKDNLKEMQTKVYDAVSNIRNYSQDISADSVYLTSSMSKVSEGAQTQSATVEEISVSVENISDIIKDNTEKAKRTSDNSLQISDDIMAVASASGNTLGCIRNVIEKAQVINEITHKTDILAVNAAVAASRAGEHGKAFAVVAEEIRKLSERCQKASVEINVSSAESLKITQNSARLIDQISPRIQENARKVAEISDSCAEQLQKTLQIQQAIQQLVDITVVNSQSAEQLDIFSGKLSEKLSLLNDSVDFFKLDDTLLDRESILELIDKHTGEIVQLNEWLGREEQMDE